MRHTAAPLAAVLAFAGTAADGPGRPTSSQTGPAVVHAVAPPPGHTGGFGEPTCVICHLGAPLNVPGGRVSIEGLPDAYRPGEEHVLTVVLESEEMGAAGFQLTARFADGAAAGVLRTIDGRVSVTPGAGGVPYAHQTTAGSRVLDPNIASWTVSWTAPAGGTVHLHTAANSANGDDSPLSDLVYASSVTLAPGG